MSLTNHKLEVSLKQDAHVAILQLKGTLNAETAPMLSDVIDDLKTKGQIWLVVDFQGTEYISSAGVSALLSTIQYFRRQKGDIKLSGLSAKLLRVFNLLGLEEFFQAYPSVPQAIASFGG